LGVFCVLWTLECGNRTWLERGGIEGIVRKEALEQKVTSDIEVDSDREVNSVLDQVGNGECGWEPDFVMKEDRCDVRMC